MRAMDIPKAKNFTDNIIESINKGRFSINGIDIERSISMPCLGDSKVCRFVD
jgi:hypothetical protein